MSEHVDESTGLAGLCKAVEQKASEWMGEGQSAMGGDIRICGVSQRRLDKRHFDGGLLRQPGGKPEV